MNLYITKTEKSCHLHEHGSEINAAHWIPNERCGHWIMSMMERAYNAGLHEEDFIVEQYREE